MKFCAKLKDKISELLEKINEGEFTGREIFMAGITLFVTGMLLGMIFSPRKTSTFGSNNGNNNGTFPSQPEEDKDEAGE